jgi:transcriptional regulator with GAF, ATPase, and Fis domain
MLGLDRCTLWQTLDDGRGLVLTHMWARTPDRFPAGMLARELFPWISAQLFAGRTVRLPSVEDLPPEAASDLRSFRTFGVLSNLSVPISAGGKIFGALTFAALRDSREWTDEEVEYLELIGQVFSNALLRKRSDEHRKASFNEIVELKERLEAEKEYLKDEVRHYTGHREIIGESAPVKKLLRQIEQVSTADTTVLITGETGTGKELVARAIHSLSARREMVMVKVDCASLPAGLIESELFGRERGAYTGAMTRQVGRFQMADHSTIFLDEIGELPLELQTKLLRVLDEGEFEPLGGSKTVRVNARVIAATNRDLTRAVREGRFREDLFFRLQVFPIAVPPLRERAEDIPLLVWHFVRRFSAEMGKGIRHVPRENMEALQQYPWPGNVRELKNILEQAFIMAAGDTLHVMMPSRSYSPEAPAARTLQGAEKDHILAALKRAGWRIKGKGGAAEELGLKPSTLYAKMKKLGVPSRNGGDAQTT